MLQNAEKKLECERKRNLMLQGCARKLLYPIIVYRKHGKRKKPILAFQPREAIRLQVCL